MKLIHKFPLPDGTIAHVDMPDDAEILSVQAQGGRPTIWAAVSADAPLVRRKFAVMITGAEIPDEMVKNHIGTVLLHGGTFVVHVFELKP